MTRSRMTRISIVAVMLALGIAACGGGSPPGSGDTGLVLNGNERFGWDQPATDRGELATFRYAMYVDDVRTEAVDVNCATTRTAAGFACTARLPQLTPGTHTLQIAAFAVDGASVRESSRSTPVRVTMR
jgi:hypothetical protein